ncbi:MAG: ATP-binding cassette domain-containing protein [Gammaproteobacteria bacterium]|nr:ATP-binding cassette domain-containing protein [Gammaproteobacteria bacterium]
MVVLDNVTVRFGDVLALDRVSLKIGADRVTVIVGESGSGKSSLLQLVNGLVRPESGRITVFNGDIDYDALPALRKRIGYAVQHIGLFPHLTVGHNIGLPGRLANWDEQRLHRRIAKLLELTNLASQQLDRYPHELSGGQQQRAGLCRALLLQPPLLLLDEAFSGVDPITRDAIHSELLQMLAAEPRTVMLVTHSLREARRLADDLVILRHGRIEQQGEAEQVLAQPATDYVATLFREHL